MQLPPAEATTEKANGKSQTMEAAQADQRAHLKTVTKKEGRSRNPRNSETSSRNSEDPYQILKYPLTTEAALKELEVHNTLVFVVDKRADKKKIRAAVEKLYDIKTKKVNTSMRPDGRKKAFVMCKTSVAKTFGLL